MCLLKGFDELAQHGLEGGAVPVVFQLGGAADALHGVVGGNAGCIVGALATNQRAHKAGCVNIACAVAAVGQQLMLIVAVNAVFQHHDAGGQATQEHGAELQIYNSNEIN